MSVKVEFSPRFPETAQPTIAKVLKEFTLLFPLWLQRLDVTWTDSSEIEASMTVQKDYRWCQLDIGSALMRESAAYIRETLIHEILHCFTAPLEHVAVNMVSLAVPDSPEVHALAEFQLDQASEAVTQDFTYSLIRLIDSYKK